MPREEEKSFVFLYKALWQNPCLTILCVGLYYKGKTIYQYTMMATDDRMQFFFKISL